MNRAEVDHFMHFVHYPNTFTSDLLHSLLLDEQDQVHKSEWNTFFLGDNHHFNSAREASQLIATESSRNLSKLQLEWISRKKKG